MQRTPFPLLLFQRTYIYICIQTQKSSKGRSPSQILADIANLPPSVQGTISSYKNPRKNGPPSTYYNLQYTHKGKNHSFPIPIPVDKVDEFKAAVASGKILRDLGFELSDANARSLAERMSPLKENSRRSS